MDNGQFVSAVVAGYEVAARLSTLRCSPNLNTNWVFHPTATCGVLWNYRNRGETSAPERGANAFRRGHRRQHVRWFHWSSWRRAHGPSAFIRDSRRKTESLAATLAAAGFQAPATILEGRDGFLWAYSRKAKPNLITQDLGQDFEIMRTSIKPHACCRYMQASIDALIELANAHDIYPEQVERVEVAVLEAGWSLVCEPRVRKYSPANSVDAQFSMPYGAAVALIDRAAGLDQFTGESFRSSLIKSLMGKVVLQKDMRIEKNFPVEWPALVSVHMTNGAHYEKYVRFPKGDPENPLTWQELSAKFHSLGSVFFPRPAANKSSMR